MGPPGELFDQAMQHDYLGRDRLARNPVRTRRARSRGHRRDRSTPPPTAGRSRRPKPSCCCRPCSAPGPTRPSSPWPTPCAPGPSSPTNTPSCAPSRRKSAPRSTNRCAGIRPSRMAGRIATRDVEIDDYVIPAGTRCGLMFAAANRDPRFWDAPDDYRLDRDTRHSLGWGYGVHGCVGRTLAQMEASALLGAIVAQVESIELAGRLRAVDDHRRPRADPPADQAQASPESCTSARHPHRRDPLRPPRAQRGGQLHRPVDDHDLPMPLDYFVWAIHRDGQPAGDRRHRLRRDGGGGARADDHPPGDRGAARRRDRPPVGRGRDPDPPALRSRRLARHVPQRAVPRAGRRAGLRHRAPRLRPRRPRAVRRRAGRASWCASSTPTTWCSTTATRSSRPASRCASRTATPPGCRWCAARPRAAPWCSRATRRISTPT